MGMGILKWKLRFKRGIAMRKGVLIEGAEIPRKCNRAKPQLDET